MSEEEVKNEDSAVVVEASVEAAAVVEEPAEAPAVAEEVA